MITYNMNVTYLTCLLLYKFENLQTYNPKQDVITMLANVSPEERHDYVQYLHNLTGGEKHMQLFKVRLLSEDGEMLVKCLLECPALLVNYEGDVLEIAECEYLENVKRNSHTVIPLPRNQETIDKFFLENDLCNFIDTYLELARVVG